MGLRATWKKMNARTTFAQMKKSSSETILRPRGVFTDQRERKRREDNIGASNEFKVVEEKGSESEPPPKEVDGVQERG
jgi:hypothetical protein